MTDLTAAAGVSERTLRTVFLEQFGISPHGYVDIHRLHQLRQTLRDADPADATVEQSPRTLGVWDEKTLARRYRTLFGENPSTTLRRGRD